MSDSATVEIDGKRYRIAPLPAMVGWPIGLRVLELRGRVLSRLTASPNGGAIDLPTIWRSLGGAQAELAAGMREPGWWSDVVEPLLQTVSDADTGAPVLGRGWEVRYAGGAGLALLARLYRASAAHAVDPFCAALASEDPALAGLATSATEMPSPT